MAILGVVLSSRPKLAGSAHPQIQKQARAGTRCRLLHLAWQHGHLEWDKATCAGKGSRPGHRDTLSGVPGHPFPHPAGARSSLLPDNHRCVPGKVSMNSRRDTALLTLSREP